MLADNEKLLLSRRWEYTNEFRTFGNVMGKMEGFGTLDLRTDGLLILRDHFGQFEYSLIDRTMEISLPVNPKNVLRLRIGELTSDKLTIIVIGQQRDEVDNNPSKEIVELTYRPIE